MNRLLIASAGLALALTSVAATAQETSARTVQYHSQDIVPIHAKLKYTTLIEVPPTEKIMEAATGDKDFWVVDVVGMYGQQQVGQAQISPQEQEAQQLAAKERELAYNSRFASNLVYTHQPDTAAYQQAPAGPEGATVAGYQLGPNPYTSASGQESSLVAPRAAGKWCRSSLPVTGSSSQRRTSRSAPPTAT
jgi:hypothetical protein